MNMNFDSKLKAVLQVESGSLEPNAFVDKLHNAQHKLDIRKARYQSSLATTAFLFVFGWIGYSQLNSSVFDEVYMSYDEPNERYTEFDSTSYDLYVADMALYLLDEEDTWAVLEFFQEENYETAFNTKQEINL